jgi:hypothetical protein
MGSLTGCSYLCLAFSDDGHHSKDIPQPKKSCSRDLLVNGPRASKGKRSDTESAGMQTLQFTLTQILRQVTWAGSAQRQADGAAAARRRRARPRRTRQGPNGRYAPGRTLSCAQLAQPPHAAPLARAAASPSSPPSSCTRPPGPAQARSHLLSKRREAERNTDMRGRASARDGREGCGVSDYMYLRTLPARDSVFHPISSCSLPRV